MGVIPSIRVRDMAQALAFYMGRLEFTLDSGGEGATSSSLTRGDGHLMMKPRLTSTAISTTRRSETTGSRSSIALYIEAEDLAAFYSRLKADGAVRIIDPLAPRPWGQEEFTVEDHEGNWLTFWSKPG